MWVITNMQMTAKNGAKEKIFLYSTFAILSAPSRHNKPNEDVTADFTFTITNSPLEISLVVVNQKNSTHN